MRMRLFVHYYKNCAFTLRIRQIAQKRMQKARTGKSESAVVESPKIQPESVRQPPHLREFDVIDSNAMIISIMNRYDSGSSPAGAWAQRPVRIGRLGSGRPKNRGNLLPFRILTAYFPFVPPFPDPRTQRKKPPVLLLNSTKTDAQFFTASTGNP